MNITIKGLDMVYRNGKRALDSVDLDIGSGMFRRPVDDVAEFSVRDELHAALKSDTKTRTQTKRT